MNREEIKIGMKVIFPIECTVIRIFQNTNSGKWIAKVAEIAGYIPIERLEPVKKEEVNHGEDKKS